ncbi:MAG: hypothetical protein KQH57_08125 [Actinomycetales bacterium]|nr:hypothetical protein [Actinomycetales bacterium]
MPTQRSTPTLDVHTSYLQAITRDSRGLRDALAVIDGEGWDGETATNLLTYIRCELIRPLTIDTGLRGGDAWEGEMAAWEAVWLKLRDPHLRAMKSPWGVIWQTARRAVLGEILAARWGTARRRGWVYDADERAGRVTRPISLEPLLSEGLDIALDTAARGGPPTPVAAALDLAAGALADSGWSGEKAKEIVGEVAIMEVPLGEGRTVVGWRPLADRLAIPPWQARRLTVLLRGSADRQGLLARLIAHGPRALDAPDVHRALAGTLIRTTPARPSEARHYAQVLERESRPQPGVAKRASSASSAHTW